MKIVGVVMSNFSIGGEPVSPGFDPLSRVDEEPVIQTDGSTVTPSEQGALNQMSNVLSSVGTDERGTLESPSLTIINLGSATGGHAGNKLAKVTIAGKTECFFLKKIPTQKGSGEPDLVEYANNINARQLAPGLAKFTPQVHGEVTINGERYMIQKALESVVSDCKLSALDPDDPNFHPTCSQEEMLLHGGYKDAGDYERMRRSAHMGEGYLVAKGYNRYANYADSKANFLQGLEPITPKEKAALAGRLRDLRAQLENSNIALIGSSIFFERRSNGEIHPYIGDLAHIMVSPDVDAPPLSFQPSKAEFEQQQRSNLASLDAIITTLDDSKVQTVRVPEPSKSTFRFLRSPSLSPPNSGTLRKVGSFLYIITGIGLSRKPSKSSGDRS